MADRSSTVTHGAVLTASVIEQCRTMIQVGSKSFSLASHVFEKKTRDAAILLYGWCRHCDDEIDRVEADTVSVPSSTLKEERLRRLREEVYAAYRGHRSKTAVFMAFHHVVITYSIPEYYPLELLEGMAMDVRCLRYQTFEDLLLYCYRVAGVVGLMMSHIMGVSDCTALKHASDMGIAMQLTNIARDVMEDFGMGRIYLPLQWLVEEGIPEDRISDPSYREGIVRVVERLLQRADEYYASGDEGLRFLPFRAALTIACARQIYSEIGVQVRRRGVTAWDRRVWTSTPRKLVVMARGLFRVLASLPLRLRAPWQRADIGLIWRPYEFGHCER